MIATPPPPALTVVVNFYNMRREAARTLHTLQPAYQRGVDAGDYAVVAIDNGSTEPLDGDWVRAHGPGFAHEAFKPRWPSPCEAINDAVRRCTTEYVMVCIDGARMLSPGLLRLARLALGLHPHPFVYTLGMHLGPKLQNVSMEEGYDQAEEDRLLGTVDWRADGYALFDVSCVAGSSGNGYFSRLSESNCFAMRRGDFLALGGLDERFTGPGGGLVNLDLFNLAHEAAHMQPVMLLGEATFHQFHGGVATNTPKRLHPFPAMAREYQAVRGKPYANAQRPPIYLGEVPAQARRFLVP
jgi:hypothetical protein